MIIVGVSDEDEKLVEGFIKQFAVKFPIAISPNGGARYRISGYPTQFLIGADGTILASGHVPEAQILEALTKVDMPPKLPETPEFAALIKAWKAGRYGEVARELTALEKAGDKLGDHASAVSAGREAFQKVLTRVQGEVQELGKGPDYYASEQRLLTLAKKFEGLPPAAEAQAVLKGFANDAKIAKELAAGKQLAQLRKSFDSSKNSGKRKLEDALRAFVEKYKGTAAAAEAQKQLAELK